MMGGRAGCWVSEDMLVAEGVFFSVLLEKRWEVGGDDGRQGARGV